MATRDTGWRLDATYARLPEPFHAPARPARVNAPAVAVLNHALADELGLDLRALPPDEAAALFAGQALPPGSRPLAQAYAGHQYGHFTMLGDGRALLLGEHRTPAGRRVDVQLKGSGPTRYSRGGDGRAALGPMLREYVVGEAMHALGVPTTRGLAVVTTGEPVVRDVLKRGAVLTRVAASHLRVGTFEYAAALQDVDRLRALADYAIARHDPGLADAPDRYLAFFRAVVDRQAALVAGWMLVGFVHGVLNTDNVAVSGETLDYGPCAFLDDYDPQTVFSSIDAGGRYAYGNQPGVTHWNLARFAEALLPIIDPDPERAVERLSEPLAGFPAAFDRHWTDGVRRKLGLRTAEAGDRALAEGLLGWMHRAGADFTNTFRDLSAGGPPAGDRYGPPEFRAWYGRWEDRLRREGGSPAEAGGRMRAVNPAVIPRNHRLEEALAAAEEQDDLAPLYALVAAVSDPYTDRPEAAGYREPGPAGACYRTYCGT